jgi:hypothetical protein
MFEYFNGYWNWASVNPQKVNPTTTSIYFYILSVANELHWRESFGLSATQIMNGVNIATYKTYKKHFDELIDNGLIKVVQPSINQYKCNVIALVKFTEAQTIARPKHGIEHDRGTDQGTTHIHKTFKEDIDNKEYKEKKTKEPKSKSDFVLLVDSKKYFGNDPILKELFVDFIDMRIRIKKTPTEKALDLLANKLRELSKGNKAKAMKIIENSIERNWAGFFDIDSPTSFSKPIQPTFSRASNGVHFSGANSDQ